MMKRENRNELWEFANRFFLLLSAIVTLICVVGIACSSFLVRHLFARGFSAAAGQTELTVSLTRWMFFYLLFISLAAMAQGILNSFGRFQVPAFTPILLNLAVIGAAFLLGRRMVDPAYAFAVGVMAGGVLQLAFQLPFIYRLGFRIRPTLRLTHPASREVLRLMVPALFGGGIYQINVAVSQAIATYLGEGAVSSLQYSSRLLELTLGVFVISLATVILPTMSRQMAEGGREEALGTLAFAIRMVVFISLPCSIGLILLRVQVVNLLFNFEGGLFDRGSVALTSWAVLFHLLGLVPVALTRVSVSTFYAAKDIWTPVKVAFGAMVINLAGCLILPRWFDHGGIALANTVAALFQAALLLPLIRSRFGSPSGGWGLGPGLLRTALAGAVMGVVIGFVSGPVWQYSLNRSKPFLAGGVVVELLLGAAVYFAAARLFGASEPSEILGLIRRRRSAAGTGGESEKSR